MVDARKIGIGISPQGENIIFSANGAGGAGIFCLNLEKLQVSTIIDTKFYESHPTIVPQSMDVVFSVMEKNGGRLYILRSSKQTKEKESEHDQLLALKKEQAIPLTQIQQSEKSNLSYFDASPVASPDGEFIYFMRAHRNRDYSMGGTIWVDWDLYKLQLSNRQTTRLTHSNFYMMSPPQVAPGNDEVIFSFDELTPSHVKAQSIRGVAVINKNDVVRRLPTKDTRPADISFGISKNELIFISDLKEKYDYELCISDISFSNPRILTDEKSYLLRPIVDPQKEVIYFLNDPDRNGKYQLWHLQMKRNGTGKAQQLAGASLFTEPLRWVP